LAILSRGNSHSVALSGFPTLEDESDSATLWLFRERIAKAGLIDKLFERFGQHVEAKGISARGGQMVDPRSCLCPGSGNSRDENEQVKSGETPKDWQRRPCKESAEGQGRVLDQEAWGQLFGYRNHVTPMPRHKLIRANTGVTDASVHDSSEARRSFE